MEDLLKPNALAFVVLFCSCSYFKRRESPPVVDEKLNSQSHPMPQVQYDDLLKKYEDVLAQNRELEDQISGHRKLKCEEKGSTVTERLTEEKMKGSLVAQVAKLKKGLRLYNSRNFDASGEIFRKLETSDFSQVKVRAKYYMGEILMEKKEYDLALKVFEQILSDHAYSSKVLGSLKNLITCSKKLGLKEKMNRYHSLYYDIFKEKS